MLKKYREKHAATLTRRYTTTVCNIAARKDANRKGGGPRYELLAIARPIDFDLVWWDRKWDKKNRTSEGLCPGVDPPRSEPAAEPFLLNRKIPTEEE